MRFFPQLHPTALIEDDELRQSLLTAAEPGLWVYARRDLSAMEVTPSYLRKGKNFEDVDNPVKGPQPFFPKKDEPLLLVSGKLALTTDGALFLLKRRQLLSTAPSGAAVPPKAARDEWMSLREAMKVAPPADQDILKKVKDIRLRWKKCSDRVWDKPSRKQQALRKKIDRLRNVYTKAARVERGRLQDRIDKIQVQTRRKERSVCKSAQVRRTEQTHRKTLMQRRTRRRETVRKQVAQRLTP